MFVYICTKHEQEEWCAPSWDFIFHTWVNTSSLFLKRKLPEMALIYEWYIYDFFRGSDIVG